MSSVVLLLESKFITEYVHRYLRETYDLSTMTLDEFQTKINEIVSSIPKKDKYEYNGWKRELFTGNKWDSPFEYYYDLTGTVLEKYINRSCFEFPM